MTLYITLETVFPAWMQSPLVRCRGKSDFMFPVNNGVGAAKALCNGSLKSPPCAFRNTCLRYAIDRVEDHGVWGGTSERERRRIQRARKKFNNPFIYSSEDIAHPNVVYIKRRSSVYVKRRTIKKVA